MGGNLFPFFSRGGSPNFFSSGFYGGGTGKGENRDLKVSWMGVFFFIF